MAHRLFVALRPPPAVRLQLAATMVGVPGARWQDDAQLHLTLRFVGTVDRHQAEDIATALSGVVAPAPTVALAGVGRFERRGRTEAVWAGVTPHDAVAALHRKVDHALVRCGLEPERRAYLPHLTLARFSRSASPDGIERWLADHAALASPPFTLGRLILFESRLGGEGARYEAVTAWPLGGTGSRPDVLTRRTGEREAMPANQLEIDDSTVFDNVDAEQVEFTAEVDGDDVDFVVQYDVLEALSGDPPEGDAADTFNRFSDAISEAALSALSRNPSANPVIVSENDLE
jgi:2'-5' RNA ligase